MIRGFFWRDESNRVNNARPTIRYYEMIKLVEFWKSCDLSKPPFVHDADRPYIEAAKNVGKVILRSHRAFVEHPTFGDRNDSSLHLGLLPIPFQGNLSKADVFIVLLNPGLGLSAYQTEEDKEHAEQVRLIIKQELANVPFPFLSLNPDYAWTGGFQWWERKLRNVIELVAAGQCKGNYAEALRLLSQRLAAIELFPYRSRTFNAASLRSRLPSVREARDFVQRLLPRAKNGEVTIIVSRGIKSIGIDDHELVNYDAKHARGASLSLATPGGRAIVNALKLRPPQ